MLKKKWLDNYAATQFGCKIAATPDLKCLCAKNNELKQAALDTKTGIGNACNESEKALGLKVAADVCACVPPS
jgi:hypothetical protein